MMQTYWMSVKNCSRKIISNKSGSTKIKSFSLESLGFLSRSEVPVLLSIEHDTLFPLVRVLTFFSSYFLIASII